MEELDIFLIGKKSVHGILALISRQFFLQLISIVAFLIISSKLSSYEIGIYTAVIAIQRVISFVTDFGLGAALVQKKDSLTNDDITTSFTLQSGLTLAIFLLVFIFQFYIFSFFRLDYAGGMLLLTLVFSIFLSSFKTIPSILLERHIRFDKLIIPQIIESLVFNFVLILLVLKQFGIASYTWAFLLSSLIGIPAYYAVSPWRMRIGISRQSLHHLKFGTQFQIKNILATVKDDMLTVILTRFLSFGEIGYIGFAQRIAFLAYRFIVDSVTKVTFSTYSRLQEDKAVLKKAIEKSLFFVSSFMFPVLTGLILTMPYFIKYYSHWQNKWEPALFSLIFFCLNAMISSLSGILINVLDATGRVKITLYMMVFWTILTWTITPILIWFLGYNGVALASFLVTLTIGITVYFVKQFVEFELFRNINKPVISAVCMGIVVFIFTRLIVHDLITLSIVIMLGALTYLTCFYLIAKDELFEGISIIRSKYGK